MARDWGKERGRGHSHTLVASQRLLLHAQVELRWPARRPCSCLRNGARVWASCLNSRPNCRGTVSVTSVGLRGAQEALVHMRSDQGGGGTSPAFPDLWLSRNHLCLVTGRLVWTASSKKAVGRVLGAAAALFSQPTWFFYSHVCTQDPPGRPPLLASLSAPWGAGGAWGSGWTISKACVAHVGMMAIMSSTPAPALVFSECHTLEMAPQHPGGGGQDLSLHNGWWYWCLSAAPLGSCLG